MIEIRVSADLGDGNDALEASMRLPAVPRVGEQIEVWNPKRGFMNRDGPSGEEAWLIVEGVRWTSWSAPEAPVTLWVRLEHGYDAEELREVMEALDRNAQP